MLIVLVLTALANAAPTCVARAPGQSTRAALEAVKVSEAEVLTRLVYAEATSTGFVEDPLVHASIAWGAMNRVRLAERFATAATEYGRGISGVVFQRGQFNPAVSTRSIFAKEFLCPDNEARWAMARAAVGVAMDGKGNPFIRTDWEREHGLSLVVNFYYPASVQARGVKAPWEHDGRFDFLGDVQMAEGVLPASRVRFYRLRAPPRQPGAAH